MGKKRFRKNKAKDHDTNYHRRESAPIVRENEFFSYYYKKQHIVKDDGEWELFMSALRRDLPLTFRISGCNDFSERVQHNIQNKYYPAISNAKHEDGEVFSPPTPLAWYPQRMGWMCDFSKAQLRRIPEMKAFHAYAIALQEIGTVCRQEAVSMIPPFFLDVASHHAVLDMCASPGSKTRQLIDRLHGEFLSKEEQRALNPTGFVVANDSDYKRCCLLMHQLKYNRTPNVLVTCHDAAMIPSIILPDNSKLQFDRILADVPCSGDGTLRKAPDLWPRWSPAQAFNLHSVQLRIALRGVCLLKVGGLMVYSTCSLNPIENEAVVSTLLLQAKGALEIIDCQSVLPQMPRYPGLATWSVIVDQNHRDLTIDDMFTEKSAPFREEMKDSAFTLFTQLLPSMFPPSEAVIKEQNIHRCMRFLPHLDNTGGFFVAVLRKVKEIQFTNDSAPAKESPVVETADILPVEDAVSDALRGTNNKPRYTDRKGKHVIHMSTPASECLFEPVSEIIKEEMRTTMGLTASFSWESLLQHGKQNVHYFNEMLVYIINCRRWHVVNGGLRISSRARFGINYTRIAQEGTSLLLPYLAAVGRVVTIIDPDTLLGLLGFKANTSWCKITEIINETDQAAFQSMPEGSIIIRYVMDDKTTPPCDLLCAAMRVNSALFLFVDKTEGDALRLQLGETVVPKLRKHLLNLQKEADDGKSSSGADEDGAEEGCAMVEGNDIDDAVDDEESNPSTGKQMKI